jgi:uncharacterized RDD family membrane protein YckC
MIPTAAIIRIHNPYWRSFQLWIPLFLLWIPVLLLSPLILLVLLAGCIVGGVDFFFAIRTFWEIFVGLRGTDVRVAANDKHVTVRIV